MKKVAFITGASRGIGKIVAEGLAHDGYHLALIATNKEKLVLLQRSLAVTYPEIKTIIFPLDVTDVKAVQDAVDKTIETLGSIDLLFNNAGINISGTSDLSHSDFNRLMEVNVKGAFNVIHAVVPGMKAAKKGYIFNLSSIAGKFGFAPAGGYCSTKFALLGFSEALFYELGPYNIKVTALCPSWVNTDMASHSSIPKTSMIQTDDILNAVRFVLTLSNGAGIKEMVIECRSDFIS